MWTSRRDGSAMATHVARPWTPPSEADRDEARSDYFSDGYRRPSSVSSRVSLRSKRYDSSTESSRAKTKEPAPFTPFTPKRAFSDAAPRYPYTPDSSQILRTHGSANYHHYPPSATPATPDSLRLQRTRSSTPLSPIPWHDDHEDPRQPYDASLAACLLQFQHLLQSHPPTPDQVEYIISQVDAMTSRLTAQNNAVSPCPSPHPQHAPGCGADGADDADDADVTRAQDNATTHSDQEYVAEVGRYVEAVAKYIRDLTHRMEEVETLNSIQLDAIDELRQQIKAGQQATQSSSDMQHEQHTVQPEAQESDSWEPATSEAEVEPVEEMEPQEPIAQTTPLTPRSKPGFWASVSASFSATFGEALDSAGEALDEVGDSLYYY